MTFIFQILQVTSYSFLFLETIFKLISYFFNNIKHNHFYNLCLIIQISKISKALETFFCYLFSFTLLFSCLPAYV